VAKTKVIPHEKVEAQEANEGASKLKVRWLITKQTGAPNFAMRFFEMEPGGHSPYHNHPWEHEVYILEGQGVIKGDKQETKFQAGDAVFVPPNDSNKKLRFLCLVPHKQE